MSDSTPLTPGNAAPDPNPSSDAPRSGSKAFDRDSYATEINKGYGVAMSRGLELAITLAVMVVIGVVVDRIFDTAPLFTIIFSVVGFAGTGVKLKTGYDLEMRKHEEGAVWNRKPGAAS